MRHLLRALCALPVLALVATTPALAQMPGKEYLIGGFERQKGVLLQYVDAMPDSAWHFSPTPGVRNYAQQLEHIAQATTGLTRRVTGSTLAAPAFPAAADYLNNREQMRVFMAAAFDDAIAVVHAMSDADMAATRAMFGMSRTGWQWVIGIQEHTAWTLGSVVPYLRLNGVTPPTYLAF